MIYNLKKFMFCCIFNQRGSIFQLKLGQHVFSMGIYSHGTEKKFNCYFLVSKPISYMADDFYFPFGQVFFVLPGVYIPVSDDE